MLLLTSHNRIIVLFASEQGGQFIAMGNLELRRLIPRQSSGVFGVQ